jgi:UDP-GlcNAc:undecaprenyl-phosphate GlcNAc-1-phosphate transferase
LNPNRTFPIHDDLVSFAGAFLVAAAVTAVAAGVFGRDRFGGRGLDVADEPRKRHAGVVPRVGGLGICAAFAFVAWREGVSPAAWFGGLALFALGFGDDLVRLNSRRKLVAQLLVAAACHALGLRWDGWPGGMWVSLPVTVAWIVGWTNAMNLIDGLNGLAAGIAGLGLAAAAWLLPDSGMALGMAGAAAGFFGFNFPRARVFLGDGGAYLFGFVAAALALEGSSPGNPWGPAVLGMVFCVPWLDTVFAVVRRAGRRQPLMKGDAEHVHHRLRDRGWGETGAVLALLGITALSGAVAVAVAAADAGPGRGWIGAGWVAAVGLFLAWAGAPTAQNSSSASPSSSSKAGSGTASSSST